jgi:hypothetical protein
MTKRGKPDTILLPIKAKLDGPTPEQLGKGDFGRKFTMHVETATEAMTHVSRHDPVERWKASERLSGGQIAAIELMQRLWHLTGLHQRVTASYGERIPGGGNSEARAINEIEAREDLHRIQDYFPGALKAYYAIFENVCRHGIAAGIAGGDDRNGAHTAYTTVCFVADYISARERL